MASRVMKQVESMLAKLPEGVLPGAGASLGVVGAIGQVVIKELARRKDFYVLFILTALITFALAAADFFGETQVVRYVKEISLLLIWVASIVITVTTAARQIPAERESRTIYPLLAKPVTRDQLVWGKFLGCWWAAGLTLGVFYLFLFVLSGAREGVWLWTAYFQAATLHWFMLGVVVAMTLLGSVVFAAPSSNSTIVFVVVSGILLLGRHLHRVALQLDEPAQTMVTAVYFVVPHLELFDVRNLIIHDWATIGWVPWVGALGYAMVYAALFLGAACLVFRRKHLH